MEYKALTNIQHDGEFYPHGSTIEVDGKAAEQLLERQAIEKLTQDAEAQDVAADPVAGGEAGGEVPSVSLDEAYEMLQADIKNGAVSEANAYTSNGAPVCGMLGKYAGRGIGTDERNEWWANRGSGDESGDGEQAN